MSAFAEHDRRKWEYFALLGIVALSFLLRSYRLEVVPPWYIDEGENLNIAYNLEHGRLQWFAIKYSFIPRPPLFLGLSAALIKAFGNHLLSLRVMSAAFGVLTTVIVYFIGRYALNSVVGLLSAFLFAIFPLTVIQNRMAITLNLNELLITATVLFLLKYRHKTQRSGNMWFTLSCATAGLSVVTDYQSATVPLSLLFLTALSDGRQKVGHTAASLLPVILLAVIMLAHDPQNVIRDLNHAFFFNFWRVWPYVPWVVLLGMIFYATRKANSTETVRHMRELLRGHGELFSLLGLTILAAIVIMPYMQKSASLVIPAFLAVIILRQTLPHLKYGYKVLLLFLVYTITLVPLTTSERQFTPLFIYDKIGGDMYFLALLGIIGLTVLADNVSATLLAFLLPLYVLEGFISPATHRIALLNPFLVVGVSLFMYHLSELVSRRVLGRVNDRLTCVLLVLLALVPAAFFVRMDYTGIRNGEWGEEDLGKHQRIKEFIDGNGGSRGVMVLPTSLTYLAGNAQAVYWPQVLAYRQKYAGYEVMNNLLANASDIPHERFVFQPVLFESSFVVLDEFAYNVLNESIPEDVREIESWPKKKIGGYTVYVKPQPGVTPAGTPGGSLR